MHSDPETMKQIVQHAQQASPWYYLWVKEIAAGVGVSALWALKLIGGKELERRAGYATADSMGDCKGEILAAISDLKKEMVAHTEEEIRIVHGRIDNHLENGDHHA